MAHTFPDEIPPDVRATRSERALFEALKADLPDDYYVYFAMPFIDADAQQGEVDFIILHPVKGMLFLECKGTGIERDHDGTWYRHKGKKRERMSQTPAEQAKKQVEALVTKFRAPCARLFGGVSGRFPMVYGWALAFPFTSWNVDDIPPDVEPDIFLDAEILSRPLQKIEQAFDFWARANRPRHMVTTAQFDLFRTEVLSPELKLVPNLGGALQAERRQMIRLSAEQSFLANMFIANKRIMVSGGAGTGKTVLALHCARLLAMEGNRVLLLCFNRALADHLRQTTEELNRHIEIATAETVPLKKSELAATTMRFQRPDFEAETMPLRTADIAAAVQETAKLRTLNVVTPTTAFRRPDLVLADKSAELKPQLPGTIEVTNFHRLCGRAAWALGEPFKEVVASRAEETKLWLEHAPKVLWRALNAGKLGPWDAVIIDEGQDFAPAWWEILERGVTDGGHMAIFYDATQSLFEHGGGMPQLGPIMPLQRNYRNTREISRLLHQLVPTHTASHPQCPTGTAPIIIRQSDAETTRRQLAEIIDDLVKNQGIKYHQIAILTPRSPKNSVLNGTINLHGIPIVHNISDREKGVFHTTITGFQGLESDIVFMLDIDPAHERCSPHARYVGASRACLRLYVFEKQD